MSRMIAPQVSVLFSAICGTEGKSSKQWLVVLLQMLFIISHESGLRIHGPLSSHTASVGNVMRGSTNKVGPMGFQEALDLRMFNDL